MVSFNTTVRQMIVCLSRNDQNVSSKKTAKNLDFQLFVQHTNCHSKLLQAHTLARCCPAFSTNQV